LYRTSVKRSRRIHEDALRKWQTLAASLRSTQRVTILESTFFQTTIGWLQLMDLPRQEILDYVGRVEQRIETTQPVLVYLFQKDPVDALRRIRAQRGDWFEELLVSQLSKTPFGRARGFRDFEDVIQFFVGVRSITDEIYARSRFKKVALDTTDRAWTHYLDAITDALRLPRIDHHRAASTRYEHFIGTYRSRALWRRESITIAADEDGLFFADAARTRLIEKAADVFCIQGMCVELSFRTRGSVVEIDCTGDLPGLPIVWRGVR
jgi:hypothetical protein